MKTWEKGHPLHPLVEEYTVGSDFILDRKLVEYDCRASIAHAKTLGKAGLLDDGEVRRLTGAIGEIIRINREGKFLIRREDEDCHTAIENHLILALGDLGKKIHTARSRNDQALAALRLYYRDEIETCRALSEHYAGTMKKFAEKYGTVQFPGYTHTRKAMPSNIALWCTAFIDSSQDNVRLLEYARALTDCSPLGTGAGFGLPLETDREYTAAQLGFSGVQENPVYVQLSRGKFESTILHALTQIMHDLNRLAADLIFFSMPELGYFELPDTICTGSSIMPHKRNPDVLEIMRAYYHVVLSCEQQVKTVTANLLSGYNRDIQLTKEPVMKSFEITEKSLEVAATLFEHIKVNRRMCSKAMTPELRTVEKAYALVRKGIPFREAYKKVAQQWYRSAQRTGR